MEAEFWTEMWQRGRIPFHEGCPNRALVRHFERLGSAPGDEVLVPLCGKALDMAWLLERGRRVLGVELSPIAVEAFFAEHGIASSRERAGAFERHHGGGATLLCGDLFDLRPEDLAGVGAVYDRAALVALPAERRRRYVEHLIGALPEGVPWLLVTLEYPPGELQGPPFSVDEREVRALFAGHRLVERLDSEDILERSPGLAERGARALLEHTFLIGAA